MRERLTRLIQSQFGLHAVDADAGLFLELGLDSLDAVALAEALQTDFGVELSREHFTTVNTLVEALSGVAPVGGPRVTASGPMGALRSSAAVSQRRQRVWRITASLSEIEGAVCRELDARDGDAVRVWLDDALSVLVFDEDEVLLVAHQAPSLAHEQTDLRVLGLDGPQSPQALAGIADPAVLALPHETSCRTPDDVLCLHLGDLGERGYLLLTDDPEGVLRALDLPELSLQDREVAALETFQPRARAVFGLAAGQLRWLVDEDVEAVAAVACFRSPSPIEDALVCLPFAYGEGFIGLSRSPGPHAVNPPFVRTLSVDENGPRSRL
jgi:acyl carrier protein